jgi:hypothetical protein
VEEKPAELPVSGLGGMVSGWLKAGEGKKKVPDA